MGRVSVVKRRAKEAIRGIEAGRDMFLDRRGCMKVKFIMVWCCFVCASFVPSCSFAADKTSCARTKQTSTIILCHKVPLHKQRIIIETTYSIPWHIEICTRVARTTRDISHNLKHLFSLYHFIVPHSTYCF